MKKLAILLSAAAALASFAGPAHALPTNTWEYVTPQGTVGKFWRTGGGDWFETTPDKVEYHFKVIRENDQELLLYDGQRRLWVTLYAKTSYWASADPGARWYFLYNHR